MKKFNFVFTLRVISFIICTTLCLLASAQTAKFQLVHNTASVALDSVDVYLDGVSLVDNMAFRSATPVLSRPAATYTFSINEKTSTGPTDKVMASFTVALSNNSNQILMLAGVDTPANYAANPASRSTALRLVRLPAVSFFTSDPTKVAISFAGGVTDFGGLNIKFRQGSTLVTNAGFGDSSYFATTPPNTLFAPAGAGLIDVSTPSNVLLNSYFVDLSPYSKKSLFLFTSGFANTGANQNGRAAGLFAVDTAGGPAWQIATGGARLQVVNNSSDTTVDSIDVWLNHSKIIAGLPYKTMAPVQTIAVGTFDITFSRKNSTTDSTSVLTKVAAITFVEGASYLAMASGVVDTTKYPSNPDGIDRSFTILGANNYRESSNNATQIDLAFFNGSVNAPKLDINVLFGAGPKISNDQPYGNQPLNYVSLSPGKFLINVTSADSSIFYGIYGLDLSGQASKGAILFTSGIFGTTASASNAKPFTINLGLSNGTVRTLIPLTSSLQIVHNSPKPEYDSVDIYINNTLKVWKGFGFRSATPFMDMTPFAPYTIAVAPKGSASAAEAFYTKSLVLDSSVGYYAILSGDGSSVNPNGVSTAFNITTFKGAKTMADQSKNVDLLYFHGSPDLMKTTMQGYNGVMFISKNDAYGSFHTPYSYNPSLDNLEFALKNANTDTVLIKQYNGALAVFPFANISNRSGQAGLLFTSGYYANLKLSLDTANHLTKSQKDRILNMFIAWPDGKIDSIQQLDLRIGMKEVSTNDYHTAFYPNPAMNELNIHFEMKGTGNVNVELFDISGRLVASKGPFAARGGDTDLVIDTRDLVGGIYLCTLTINGQKIVSRISVIK